MRTDRSRINVSTRLLLDIEKDLRHADRSGMKAMLPFLSSGIYSRIDSYSHIRTSREVEEFLQLSMIYIAARLHFDFRDARETDYKVSTSVYNLEHDLFVMKPSYFFPGRCSIRHPTILLTRGANEGRTAEATDGDREVGVSGLALASGEVLHCTRLQGSSPCPFYIPLESRSVSAVSIPLTVDLAGALDRFGRAKNPRTGPGLHCCTSKKSLHPFPGRKNSAPTYGVLNIDCSTGELEIQKAKLILADREIRHVLGIMVDRLAGYRADRAAYRVLRNCTALFQLSQHTLQARQAYVALLREISEVCDGAEVTLHLRDMFDDDDRDRSVKLVAGSGPRFRGFLIGERYGDGLVGEAMSGTGQFMSLGLEEINSALSGDRQYSYRRLMPGTALNAALPIRFHKRVIGAINIEWDRRLISDMSSEETDRYLDARQPVLERLAQYFALIIDYFDDRDNENLQPPDALVRQSTYVRRSTSRRRVLAYYVDSALRRVDVMAHEAQRRERDSWAPQLELILHDIIDAVGYFLTFENKHRILASVRHHDRRTESSQLELVYAHGFNPKDRQELGPGGPIPIGAGTSVLGTCAELGVAVFGQVEESRYLRPDPLCELCAPETDRRVLRQPIHYKPAGRHPVYEVGVPLVFGGSVLGTFDFELFSLVLDRAPEENSDQPPALAGHELAPFLEWARAITFCMAYAEDALDPEPAIAELGDRHREAYRRFQRLCAQIVANVVIPHDLLTSIAGEYLRGLIPLGKLELKPGAGDGGAEPVPAADAPLTQLAKDSTQDLWWRGKQLGTISMSLDAETVPPHSVFPEKSLSTGTSILAKRFTAAFYAAALSAERSSEFDSREFKRALGSVQSAFLDRVEALKESGGLTVLGPYALIQTFFNLLHRALHRLLPEGGGGSTARQPSRHGWFLYMAQCVPDPDPDPDPDIGERAVLRSGAPFARWAAMGTEEMKSLIARVLDSRKDPEQVLGEILGSAVAEDILADWRAQTHATAHSIESLEELFLEALALRGREYPDPTRDQGPSLTAATILKKKVMSVIDLNRSPERSKRWSEWFFGDKAYGIVGVPILLADRAIGILQIFRRREAIDDVLFFKNDEIDAVGRLGKAIENAIAAEVECLTVPVLRGAAANATFTREVTALGGRLEKRIEEHETPILVSCDFLDEPASCEQFLDRYVRVERTTFTTHELLKLPTSKLEQMTVPAVCVLHHGERPTPKLRERLAALTGPGGAQMVILFVPHADERTMIDMLPADPILERQERDVSAELLPVAFGIAEGQERSKRKEFGILLRRSGTWTLERLVADCGGVAGVIRNRAKIVLKDLKERALVSQRLFPDWYQSFDGAGLPPPARHGRSGRSPGE